MPRLIHRFWRQFLLRILRRTPNEPSRLIVGSTGSGKSEGELVDLVRLADRRTHAVVLLDGHGPLAFRAAGHWGARGHEPRLVYEPLDATDRVLCWHMLPRSDSPDASRRRIDDAETIDEVAQCFLAQRNLDTLSDRPWTKEWLEAAIGLCLAQPLPEPLSSLGDAFRAGSPDYERLVSGCLRPDLAAKFRAMEVLRRRDSVQYEIQTGASRRLIELVCGSEVVRLRSRPGPFDWLGALRRGKLIVFDGGGIRSREIKRAVFLLAGMQVIHAVRRHFAQARRALPVVLVLEEAGALGLVTPFVRAALQELRKAGLAIHVITQSSVDFGDRELFQSVLANTPVQMWYQCLSPHDQELGSRALANATFDPLAVHFTRQRSVRAGSHPGAHFHHIDEPSYKSPSLHAQELRTALATLRIGERLVRDRHGVRRERTAPVRRPWFRTVSDAVTRALIDRVRVQPIYLAGEAGTLDPPAPVDRTPDAGARLEMSEPGEG